MASLIIAGYAVFLPFADNGPVDMIALNNGLLYRVSVKSTSVRARYGTNKWVVALKTVSRRKAECAIKLFDPSECDLLAVYIATLDKVVFIEASTVRAKHMLHVSGELAESGLSQRTANALRS